MYCSPVCRKLFSKKPKSLKTCKICDTLFLPKRISEKYCIFSCTLAVGSGMLFGEVDATSAYMAGDILHILHNFSNS
ncbi:MAG: hypothetical protein ACTSPS_16250 [Promethearchaeota archaeon]